MKKNSKVTLSNADLSNFNGITLKTARLLSIVAPLICVFILTPIASFIKVNFGLNAAYYTFYRISDAAALFSFFGVISIITLLIFMNNKELYSGVVAMECISLLAISFGAKALSVLLMALADEGPVGKNLGLYLSDYTLSALIQSNQIYEVAAIAFLSALALAIFLAVSIVSARLFRKKYLKKRVAVYPDALVSNTKSNPLHAPFAFLTAFYAIYAVINEGIETYRTVFDTSYSGYAGAPRYLSEYMYLINPYIFILLYTLCCYFVLKFVATFCAKHLLPNDGD